MSYYKPSFSQTMAMSRGSGRGFSSPRGSSTYRGSSGRGSSWNDRGNIRGGFSSNRGGRFSSTWTNSSFESHSRYPSSTGGSERYSSNSRGRPDDSSYRRSYRADTQNNYSSGRDTSAHRSPDRKRMRNEAPSSRRSHDGGYGGGDGYSGSGNASGRYESSQGGGGYSERRSFTDDRRPTFRAPRDDYRKPVSGGMSGNSSSLRVSSPRGGYRGRLNSRGIRGSRLSVRDSIVRRRIVDTGSYLRKRGTTMRSTSDYLRRLKISRLRSIATRRAMKKSKSSEKDDSDKEEENWDDEVNAEEKNKEDSDKPSEEKKPTPVKKASPKKDKEKKDDSDKDDKKSGSEDEGDRPRSRYTGRPFIRLTCTHCRTKCVTFKEYSKHLFNGRHIQAMRKIAIKQKTALARMRLAQRNTQRELEKDDDTLAPRTNFCPLCKLNYRQQKGKHQLSDTHRNMKKFLMPYCKTCQITFKSPMLYENHMCSLDHIKRKAHDDLLNGEKHGIDKEPPSPTEEDLENFMTLDSVGDVDEEDGDGNKITGKSPGQEGEDTNDKHKELSINVGEEHVKKVEVYYCDLCRMYLSRYDDTDRALKQHCRGRMHLQRYVRYKEDKDLRRQAERIHRKSQKVKEAKEKEKDKPKKEDKPTVEKDKEVEVKVEKEDKMEEDTGDDKMWADVDKDLGEILAEVDTETGNKSSDEDEDSRPDGERYDRFRYSEKGTEGKEGVKTEETEEKENEENEIEENENEEKEENNEEVKADEKDDAKSAGDK